MSGLRHARESVPLGTLAAVLIAGQLACAANDDATPSETSAAADTSSDGGACIERATDLPSLCEGEATVHTPDRCGPDLAVGGEWQCVLEALRDRRRGEVRILGRSSYVDVSQLYQCGENHWISLMGDGTAIVDVAVRNLAHVYGEPRLLVELKPPAFYDDCLDSETPDIAQCLLEWHEPAVQDIAYCCDRPTPEHCG